MKRSKFHEKFQQEALRMITAEVQSVAQVSTQYEIAKLTGLTQGEVSRLVRGVSEVGLDRAMIALEGLGYEFGMYVQSERDLAVEVIPELLSDDASHSTSMVMKTRERVNRRVASAEFAVLASLGGKISVKESTGIDLNEEIPAI